MRHDDLRGQPSGRSPVGLSHCLGIETASQSSLAKADEPRLDRGQHEGRLEHRLRKADRPMSDLTAVDILIQPDAAAITRAREVNRRDAVEHPGRDHPGRHAPAAPHAPTLRQDDVAGSPCRPDPQASSCFQRFPTNLVLRHGLRSRIPYGSNDPDARRTWQRRTTGKHSSTLGEPTP